MAMRRSLQHVIRRIQHTLIAESAAHTQQRGYAKIPGEFAEHYAGKFPTRTARRPSQDGNVAAGETHASPQQQTAATTEAAAVSAAPVPEAASTAAHPGPAAGTVEALVGETQRESARVATAFMFPWERRQMEGGKLKWWEKMYWGVFAAGMALFLFNRLRGSFTEKQVPKVDEEKETKKAELARMVLAGRSFLDGEDLFKGMSPREIEEYVSKVTEGAKSDDPFEGMTPEEINEYVAKYGMPAEQL